MVSSSGVRGSTWRRAYGLRRMLGLLGGVAVLAGVGSCSDNDNLVTPIQGLVTTFKDSNFNFATLHTFAMPDTVAHLVPATGTPLAITAQFDVVALNEVRSNLLARGYTDVSNQPGVTPDFVVLVGAAATDNFNAFVTFPWFDFWGFSPVFDFFTPGFSAAWGIVFPWAPVVGVTAFARGTLVVTIVPTASIDQANETIQSAWAGVATGLLNGSITTLTVTTAIDKMFALSPYLVNTPTP
jgi:hypothetical protein